VFFYCYLYGLACFIADFHHSDSSAFGYLLKKLIEELLLVYICITVLCHATYTFQFFISGALTGAITTPLDVIKTRLMVQVRAIGCLVFHLCLSVIFDS